MNRCDITTCFFRNRGFCTIHDDTRECRYASKDFLRLTKDAYGREITKKLIKKS